MSGVDDFDNPVLDVLYAEDTEPEWFIPDLILQGAAVILAGDAGTGKSYLSYTIGLAAASGCSALSGIVPAGDPRRVLYFDQENGLQDRNKYLTRSWWGLADSHGVPPDATLLQENFIATHFELGDDDWYERAAAFVERFQPRLMVFDTATPCFNIDDENSNSEANQAMKKIRRLMAMTTPVCSAIILKHSKVAQGKTPGATGGGSVPRMIRGAKGWKGAADALMFQVRGQGRPRKDGLAPTRLVPDKSRAYGLSGPIYITPSYTDAKRTGLMLEGSRDPNAEHRRALAAEDEGEDE